MFKLKNLVQYFWTNHCNFSIKKTYSHKTLSFQGSENHTTSTQTPTYHATMSKDKRPQHKFLLLYAEGISQVSRTVVIHLAV